MLLNVHVATKSARKKLAPSLLSSSVKSNKQPQYVQVSAMTRDYIYHHMLCQEKSLQHIRNLSSKMHKTVFTNPISALVVLLIDYYSHFSRTEFLKLKDYEMSSSMMKKIQVRNDYMYINIKNPCEHTVPGRRYSVEWFDPVKCVLSTIAQNFH